MRKRNTVARIYVALTAAFLLASCALYLILPTATSEREELTTFPAFGLGAYFSAAYQDAVEQALKDQFWLREAAVSANASIKAGLAKAYNALDNIRRGYPTTEGLTPFGAVYRLEDSDWLSDRPYAYAEADVLGYEKKAGQLNAFAQRHPEAKMYVYYCTRAEDLNWFDAAEGLHSYSYADLLAGLLSDDFRFARLKFRDLSEFQMSMYKTDHHWNNVGAARGYGDLLALLGQDFDLGRAADVLRTEDFGALRWQGSRARESGMAIPEAGLDDFKVDLYILPEHESYYGDMATEIGLWEPYLAGEINRTVGFDQYLNFFGFEGKVIRLVYPENEKNLLIVGDSYARVVREPLASHFHTTVFVNFRLLEEVDLDELMAQYDIDAVLFMGQQDAWSGYFMREVDAA